MPPLNIARHRLHNQQIARTQCSTPAEVVARLGAMQAQDYAGARWAVGLRLPDATDGDVEQALAKGSIIRTWPMRGTLHFVPAEDVRWMLALLTPRVIARGAARYRQLELDDATFARSQAVLAKALAGGRHLTRGELSAALDRAGISPKGQRAYHILGRAGMDGLICFGVPRGSQPTFVLLDEWAPAVKALDSAAGLALLAQRYFTSHGPATVRDFAGWSGLTLAEARAGLEAAQPHLARATIGGDEYWMPRNRPGPRRTSAAHVLPAFDEYLLGYKERSAVLEPEYAHKVQPGSSGMFMPITVIDGQVVGVWKRAIKKGKIEIRAEPFRPLTAGETRAFHKAAQHFGKFHGMPVVV